MIKVKVTIRRHMTTSPLKRQAKPDNTPPSTPLCVSLNNFFLIVSCSFCEPRPSDVVDEPEPSVASDASLTISST